MSSQIIALHLPQFPFAVSIARCSSLPALRSHLAELRAFHAGGSRLRQSTDCISARQIHGSFRDPIRREALCDYKLSLHRTQHGRSRSKVLSACKSRSPNPRHLTWWLAWWCFSLFLTWTATSWNIAIQSLLKFLLWGDIFLVLK